jgi:glucosyl-dolichyl phosphate glucuronosyltransferase
MTEAAQVAARRPVSVVIACHTEERWSSLVRSIASALEQRPGPVEVIVAVDHNPRLYNRLSREISGVTVVENEYAGGASGTRNTGARHASTPFLAFLDDDAHARPGWLGTLLEPFEDELVVGTGGKVEPEWATSRPQWFPDEFAWVVGASYTGLPDTRSPVRNVWSESMAVRRDVFEAVEGFRADFGKVGQISRPEDTDLGIRMSASAPGRHWIYVPDALVDHLVPASRCTLRFFLLRSFSEGRGKVEMSMRLASDRDLGSESSYLRRTIPMGIARNVKSAMAHREWAYAQRAAAILGGTMAAAAGAVAAALRGIARRA